MNDMQKLGLFLAKMALRLKKVEDGLQNAGGSTTPEPEEPHSKFYRYAPLADGSRTVAVTFYRYAPLVDSSIKS